MGATRCAETIALAPEHVSAYALTIEPATPLGRKVAAGEVPAPDPDLQADMFAAACDVLAAAGYAHYEVSNWAKPGLRVPAQPRVLGAPAVPRASAPARTRYRDGRRWWNVRPPEDYLATRRARASCPRAAPKQLEPSDAYLEEVFLRLRTLEGVPASWVEPGVAEPYLELGLLRSRATPLVPTERGMLLLNELVLALAANSN